MMSLLEEVEEPIYETPFIWIYREPKVGVRYVAGVDVGEGVGEDDSTLTILGREGMQSEVVAVICSNAIGTDLFAYEVDKLCRRYFNPLLCVENNSLGDSVLKKLLELGYPRLYYEQKEMKKGVRKPGIATTGFNRTVNINELGQNIANGSVITRCKPQLLQMLEFHWDFDHKPARPEGGKHDDLVMSFVIANQMLKHQYSVLPEAVIYT